MTPDQAMMDAVAKAMASQEALKRADAVILGFSLPGMAGRFNVVVCPSENLPLEIYTALTMMTTALTGVAGAEVGNIDVLGVWEETVVNNV